MPLNAKNEAVRAARNARRRRALRNRSSSSVAPSRSRAVAFIATPWSAAQEPVQTWVPPMPMVAVGTPVSSACIAPPPRGTSTPGGRSSLARSDPAFGEPALEHVGGTCRVAEHAADLPHGCAIGGDLDRARFVCVDLLVESRERAAELPEIRMLRRMVVDVPGSDLEEAFVAQGGNDLGKHLPQGVDLAVQEHARVDRDALFRGQR